MCWALDIPALFVFRNMCITAYQGSVNSSDSFIYLTHAGFGVTTIVIPTSGMKAKGLEFETPVVRAGEDC